MRQLIISWILAGAVLLAQAPTAKRAGADDVVATIEGEKITPAKIQQLRESLPPQLRQAVSRMDNKQFLKSYAELLVFSRLTEKDKIAEQEPYKDQFEFLRLNFLAQAYVDTLSKRIRPSQEDLLKYYNEHKGEYDEASVRSIYIAFSPTAGKQDAGGSSKKPLTEEEAKAKAETLMAELKKGADFVTLAKANSDDAASAEKGGDIGPIKRANTGLPADVKNAIFRLTPGEVSRPVRQPAGFYIFKVEKLRTLPFEEISTSITPAVQGAKMKEELDRIRNSVKITYEDENFFKQPPMSPPPPASPAR